MLCGKRPKYSHWTEREVIWTHHSVHQTDYGALTGYHHKHAYNPFRVISMFMMISSVPEIMVKQLLPRKKKI